MAHIVAQMQQNQRKELELVFSLQWHYKHFFKNYGDIVGMYDIPNTTMQWECFKSYLFKNSGIMSDLSPAPANHDDITIRYVNTAGLELPITNQDDFQFALYTFRERARAGEINHLKLTRVKRAGPGLANSSGAASVIGPSSVCSGYSLVSEGGAGAGGGGGGGVVVEDDVDSHVGRSSSRDELVGLEGAEHVPEWFSKYMNKFKQEIIQEITNVNTTQMSSNLKKMQQAPCPKRRPAKCEKKPAPLKRRPKMAYANSMAAMENTSCDNTDMTVTTPTISHSHHHHGHGHGQHHGHGHGHHQHSSHHANHNLAIASTMKIDRKLEKLEHKQVKLKAKRLAMRGSSDSDTITVTTTTAATNIDSTVHGKRTTIDHTTLSTKKQQQHSSSVAVAHCTSARSESDQQYDVSAENKEVMFGDLVVEGMGAFVVGGDRHVVIRKVVGGEVYLQQWTLENCGAKHWNKDTELRFGWGSLLPVDEKVVCPHLKPGDRGIVAVLLKIPEQFGTFECYWHLHQRGRRFGPWLGCTVTVDRLLSGGPAPATAAAATGPAAPAPAAASNSPAVVLPPPKYDIILSMAGNSYELVLPSSMAKRFKGSNADTSSAADAEEERFFNSSDTNVRYVNVDMPENVSNNQQQLQQRLQQIQLKQIQLQTDSDNDEEDSDDDDDDNDDEDEQGIVAKDLVIVDKQQLLQQQQENSDSDNQSIISIADSNPSIHSHPTSTHTHNGGSAYTSGSDEFVVIPMPTATIGGDNTPHSPTMSEAGGIDPVDGDFLPHVEKHVEEEEEEDEEQAEEAVPELVELEDCVVAAGGREKEEGQEVPVDLSTKNESVLDPFSTSTPHSSLKAVENQRCSTLCELCTNIVIKNKMEASKNRLFVFPEDSPGFEVVTPTTRDGPVKKDPTPQSSVHSSISELNLDLHMQLTAKKGNGDIFMPPHYSLGAPVKQEPDVVIKQTQHQISDKGSLNIWTLKPITTTNPPPPKSPSLEERFGNLFKHIDNTAPIDHTNHLKSQTASTDPHKATQATLPGNNTKSSTSSSNSSLLCTRCTSDISADERDAAILGMVIRRVSERMNIDLDGAPEVADVKPDVTPEVSGGGAEQQQQPKRDWCDGTHHVYRAQELESYQALQAQLRKLDLCLDQINRPLPPTLILRRRQDATANGTAYAEPSPPLAPPNVEVPPPLVLAPPPLVLAPPPPPPPLVFAPSLITLPPSPFVLVRRPAPNPNYVIPDQIPDTDEPMPEQKTPVFGFNMGGAGRSDGQMSESDVRHEGWIDVRHEGCPYKTHIIGHEDTKGVNPFKLIDIPSPEGSFVETATAPLDTDSVSQFPGGHFGQVNPSSAAENRRLIRLHCNENPSMSENMTALFEMGFVDFYRNLQLLKLYDNNIVLVLEKLLPTF